MLLNCVVYPNYKSFTAKLDAIFHTFSTHFVLNMLIIFDCFMLFHIRSCQRRSLMQNFYLLSFLWWMVNRWMCLYLEAQIIYQYNFTNMLPATDPSWKASRNSLTQHGFSLSLGMNRLSGPVGQLQLETGIWGRCPELLWLVRFFFFPPLGRGCSGEPLGLMSDG